MLCDAHLPIANLRDFHARLPNANCGSSVFLFLQIGDGFSCFCRMELLAACTFNTNQWKYDTEGPNTLSQQQTLACGVFDLHLFEHSSLMC
jgi:hypothetical protein